MAISTETIILKVEGQTDGAVKATDKLAQSQQQLARSAQASEAQLSAVAAAMVRVPAASTTTLLSKMGETIKSIGFDSKSLSGGLKDIGKGLTFDLIRGGLKSLNEDIKGTAASALSAGVNGAAMGAAFGGPWGAAIGGAAGAIKGLVTGLLDAEEAARKVKAASDAAAEAYHEGVRAAQRKLRIEEELAPVLVQQAQYQRELAERTELVNRITNESPDAMRRAADAALAYSDQLASVNSAIIERLRLEDKIPKDRQFQFDAYGGGGESSDEAKAIRAARGQRNQDLEYYAATKSYGATLVSLNRAEHERADRMRDLAAVTGDINVSQEVRNRALKELNELTAEATKKQRDLAASSKALFEADMKAWAPILEQLREKSDAWRSARVEEAHATALAEHDMAVERGMAELENQRAQPDLEADLRAFEAIEKSKADALAGQTSLLEGMFGPIDEFNAYKSAFDTLTGSVTAATTAWIDGSMSAGAAIKAFLKGRLKDLAAEMGIEALKHGAYAVGNLAFYNYPAAAMHAKAASAFGVAAVAAGGVAKALHSSGSAPAAPGGRGGTSSGAGGAGPSGATYIVAYNDTFSHQSAYRRERDARRMIDTVTGVPEVTN